MRERPTVLVAAVLALAAATSAGAFGLREDVDERDRERVNAATRAATDFSRPEPFETKPGGGTTARLDAGRVAFSQFADNLTFENQQLFKVGNGIFRKLWVSAPASTRSSDGLGPLYNARACQSCHVNDGRGRALRGDRADTFLMRLAIPSAEGSAPDPTYGRQLQDLAVAGLPAEGKVRVSWSERPVELADGKVVSLRRPTYSIDQLGYGPMHPDVQVSPRVATPMIGLGLLEAIHPADILANADPGDADGDGISGRANFVADDRTGETVLGRFGWKAAQPTVEQQVAHAFSADMGLSTPLMKSPAGDCTAAQPACLAMPHGDDPAAGVEEVPRLMLDLVSFYSRTLAVPARRTIDSADVLAGKRIFHEAGCIACHVPKFVTRRDAAIEELGFQLIWPYTDLLLHDMGDDLGDDLSEGEASGREWRTPPLWGLGLTEEVSGHFELLHDGRARSVLEAILWHGGEAQAARDRVVSLSSKDRDALLAFLHSL